MRPGTSDQQHRCCCVRAEGRRWCHLIIVSTACGFPADNSIRSSRHGSSSFWQPWTVWLFDPIGKWMNRTKSTPWWKSNVISPSQMQKWNLKPFFSAAADLCVPDMGRNDFQTPWIDARRFWESQVGKKEKEEDRDLWVFRNVHSRRETICQSAVTSKWWNDF